MTDTYTYINNCVERLFREWKKHPRLIIAVDFDDTLYDFHSKGTEHADALDLIRQCNKLNFYVVLYTASRPERYEMMCKYLRDNGIYIDSINENPVDLPFGNNGKIYYNILLDDRAGLGHSMETLRETLRLIKDHDRNQST